MLQRSRQKARVLHVGGQKHNGIALEPLGIGVRAFVEQRRKALIILRPESPPQRCDSLLAHGVYAHTFSDQPVDFFYITTACGFCQSQRGGSVAKHIRGVIASTAVPNVAATSVATWPTT